MSRAVVPIANLQRRLPEGGRIRIGEKTTTRNGKEAPSKLDTFRFTSPDRESLEQVAVIYGGRVVEWKEPKADPGQFQLKTDATELHIVLPPDPLGGSPIYELWSGGGCDRRCDGLLCEMVVKGPDGPERTDRPCLCAAAGAMSCKPKTRLSVILPDVRFTGVWRLDTGSWNAAQELPGMVDLIQSQQSQGLSYGLLRLEWRRSVVAGQTNVYAVPVLGVPLSIEALAAGATRLGAIGPAASAPQLTEGGEHIATDGQAPSAEPPLPPLALDDEVCEAEVVVDDDTEKLGDLFTMEMLDRFLETCEQHGVSAPEVVEVATDGRTNEPAELILRDFSKLKPARAAVMRRMSQP